MKRIFIFCYIFLVLSDISLAEIVDKVVAVVNGEVITEGEVSRLTDPLYMQYKTIFPPEELDKKMKEVRKKLIQDLVDDKLLLSEAKKEGIIASQDEIDKKVKELRNTFSKKEDFDNALLYQNITVADLKERFKHEIIKGKLIDIKIRQNIDVTPMDVSNYYKEHASEFNEPESVSLRIIFLKNIGPEAKITAEDVLKLLKSGADFSEMAKKYSNATNASSGGDMGIIFKGRYKENVDKIIFSLKENSISSIVETNAGYYIFKVDKRINAHTKSFNEVKDFLRNKLYMEEAQAKLKEYLDYLKKDAYISIK